MEAIYKNIKFGNLTLKERKGILINKDSFAQGNTKDISIFRRKLNINQQSIVIAIDNETVITSMYKDIFKKDIFKKVIPFDVEYVNYYLEKKEIPPKLMPQEIYHLKYIADTVYNSYFKLSFAPLPERLTVMGEIINNF